MYIFLASASMTAWIYFAVTLIVIAAVVIGLRYFVQAIGLAPAIQNLVVLVAAVIGLVTAVKKLLPLL